MRTREYRRKVRQKKIKQRRHQIHHAGIAGELHCSCPGAKLGDMIYGEKGGYLAKHDYGAIAGNCPIKTKTKRVRTHPHRALGTYGPSYNYSKHDKKQIARMDQEVSDYYSYDVRGQNKSGVYVADNDIER